MNYGEFRDRVLQLLDRYSVAGGRVPESYNNQADLLARIPGLANDAMNEIALSTRKIPALLELSAGEGERLGRVLRFTLPGNFYQLKTGGVTLAGAEGTPLPCNAYRVQGRNLLLVPASALPEGAALTVEYYRYPEALPSRPADDLPLDNAPEVHDAAAFYAAAFLSLHEDPYRFSVLYNQYADRRDGLGPGVTAEFQSMGGGAPDNFGVYEV